MAFNTKFSLPSFLKQVENLTENQKNSIKRVGFGNLLHIPNQVLRRIQLNELMERWSCEKHAFVFPTGEITVTLLDVALILGLRVVGEPVVLQEDAPYTDLEKEFGVLLWQRTISLASLKERLESMGERDDEYFVRVFLLYCFGTLLFPNANGKVDSRYLSLLQNLDKVSHLAWGAAVLNDLYDSLSQKKNKRISCVCGCLILLQIWCYEHILIGRPELLDRASAFPRVGRWEIITRQYIKSHDDGQFFASKFKELKHAEIIWKLEPTLEEAQLDIVKELLLEQCSLTKGSIEKEYDATIRPVMLEQSIDVESETGLDMVEVHGEEAEQEEEEEVSIRQQSEPDILNYADIPSASYYVPGVPEEQTEQPLLSEGKPRLLLASDDGEDDLNTKSALEEENLKLKKVIMDLEKENKLMKILEEENLELKVVVEDLRKEKELTKRLNGENLQLKHEMENLRRENQVLGLSMDRLVSRLEGIVMDDNVD